MESQKVSRKSIRRCQHKVGQGDEESREVLVHADQVLPLKDVQVLDQLTEGQLAEAADEEVSADVEDAVARVARKRPEDEDADAERPRDERAEQDDEAEVREELVHQGPTAKVGAVLLVPDDAVQQGRTDEREEEVVAEESRFDPVQFVEFGKGVLFVGSRHFDGIY